MISSVNSIIFQILVQTLIHRGKKSSISHFGHDETLIYTKASRLVRCFGLTTKTENTYELLGFAGINFYSCNTAQLKGVGNTV